MLAGHNRQRSYHSWKAGRNNQPVPRLPDSLRRLCRLRWLQRPGERLEAGKGAVVGHQWPLTPHQELTKRPHTVCSGLAPGFHGRADPALPSNAVSSAYVAFWRPPGFLGGSRVVFGAHGLHAASVACKRWASFSVARLSSSGAGGWGK